MTSAEKAAQLLPKTLCDIPDQITVMLDTNVVIYALFAQERYYRSSKELLQRGARGELQLCLTVSAAADITHRAMILELLAQGVVQRSADAITYLKQHPQTVQQLSRYKHILPDLNQAKIAILPLNHRDLHASKVYREQFGLMTNYSFILTVM